MYSGKDPRGDTPTVVKEEIVQIGAYEVPMDVVHRTAFAPQPGAPMFDYMIDVETTGTNPEECAIIQIAAVRFNRLTKEIDHKMFDRCLAVPDGRYWSESTRDWWMGQPHVLEGIMRRMEDPAIVMRAFFDWVCEGSSICPRAFWGKPTTFDFNFLNSYFRQFGLMQPFHYREAVDLNSYLLGRGHENRREFWNTIEPVGDAHNALHDCLYQIRAVFNA
ncbi:3'-5' exonuclease [Methylobacterium aquaticum]|uniref:DNA polymerase III, epsilon subunit and related 3'-5' exonucleases n=1 Tax=Methylobacterium aquaticum TaxID=270351 RepID=A0A0C6G2F2_9HYPH|nr:3'-5' exonuclease [Methylobacterium aquaticum]BAQ50260.1 DNA polymerase III, epsilon subunit and related 3'-5' exonucleases [Methylobacterium aquaticum]